MKLNWFASVIIAGILLAVSAPVFGHHAEVVYDTSRLIELQGTVSQFRWTNPHAAIHFMVKNEQGVEEEWIAEMGPPAGLTRGGWNKTTIQAGDQIEMVSHPHKDGLHRIRFRKLVINGKVLRDELKPD